jgi:hypothetical protein
VAVGTYSLTAKLTDDQGAVDSAAVSVTVGTAVPSSVTLTAPTNGATYTAPATIDLAANATAGTGRTISKVEFYQGATLLGTDATSPYSYSWTGAAAGSYVLTAKVYDDQGTFNSAAVGVTVNAAAGGGSRTNVALASNGGVASASSSYSSAYAAAYVNNGDRKGTTFWNENTANAYPDWVQVTFNGQKTIDEIDVFMVQNTPASPVEPTATTPATSYQLADFTIQYFDGTTSTWVTVPGGNIVGNALAWVKATFTAVTTNQVRVYVTKAKDGTSRVAEIEAYTAP